MFKKISLITLSMLLSLTVMIGCVDKASQEKKNEAVRGQQNEEISAQKEANKEPAKIEVMMNDNSNTPIQPNSDTVKEMNKILGIDLVLKPVPAADYQQKKRTLMATDNLPDIILANRGDLNSFASAGIFLPLLERVEKQALNFKKYMEKIPDVQRIFIDDELYAFPTLKRFEFKRGIAPTMRTDLLKELNIEVPKSFDELYEVLKEMKKAYPDSIPMASRSGSTNILNCMAYPMGSGYGIYWDKDVDGGRYVYGTITSEMKNVIAYLRKLYEEDILDPDYANATQRELEGLMTSGKSFFYYDNPSYGSNYTKVIREKNPTAVIETIPLLENQLGNRRDDFYTEHVWESLWAISAKTKNPDEAVMLLDFCYSDKGVDLRNFGIEGIHYDMVDGELSYKPELIEKYKDDSSPLFALQSEIGVGQYNAFTPCIDMRPMRLLWEKDLLDQYARMEQDSAWHDPKLDPPFTEEERENLTEYSVQTETIMTEVIDKIIMGLESLDAFDKAAERALNGARKIEEIYNRANERYENSIK